MVFSRREIPAFNVIENVYSDFSRSHAVIDSVWFADSKATGGETGTATTPTTIDQAVAGTATSEGTGGAGDITNDTITSLGAETYQYTIGDSSAIVTGDGGGGGCGGGCGWVGRRPELPTAFTAGRAGSGARARSARNSVTSGTPRNRRPGMSSVGVDFTPALVPSDVSASTETSRSSSAFSLMNGGASWIVSPP